jgi:hypothetical protein
MRRSFLVAFSLTLFMLLLVLLSAFYFSYQSQQLLQQRLTEAQDDRATALATAVEAATRQTAELEAAQATHQTAVNALATAEADVVLLDGQLVVSQQRVEELNRQIEALTAGEEPTGEAADPTRDAAQAVSATPVVAISRPDESQTLVVGQPLEIGVAAYDLNGLASLTIRIGDEVEELVAVEGGNNLWVHILSWTPAAAQVYEISAVATNINNVPSQTVIRTVTISGASESEE